MIVEVCATHFSTTKIKQRNVRDGDTLPVDCPVICGSPCFGPLCYNVDSNSFVLQSAKPQRLLSPAAYIINHIVPKRVYAPHAIHLSNITEFKHRIDAMVSNITFAERRGSSVLHDVTNMKRFVDDYITVTRHDVEFQRTELTKAREKCIQVHTMATASIVLSAMVAPLLFIVLLYTQR